jgi:archaellum component FlaF (FlaF/FlaG flagellin family)
MGFSTIGAGVVLIVGALLVGTMILNAVFDTQRTVMRGLEDEQERRSMERAATATITNGEQDGADLTLRAVNIGGTALDASRIVVFIDGAYANALIQDRDVDGKTTDVWAPQQELLLRLDVGIAPVQRAYLVLETGTGITWTPEP